MFSLNFFESAAMMHNCENRAAFHSTQLKQRILASRFRQMKGNLFNLWIGNVVIFVAFQFLVLEQSFFIAFSAKGKSPSNAPTSALKNKPIRLNVDILPPLLTVLEELELKDYTKDFIRMGITETRLLLRLSNMDFQMMTMNWPDFEDEKLQRLKQKIKVLLDLATIREEPENPELQIRKNLHYGRIFLQHGVTSFEFQLASFGGFPVIGWQALDVSPSLYECSIDNNHQNYQKRVLIVKRGICPFVEKALNAFHQNASGLIIINHEDKIESPSSGVGIYPNITDAMIAPLSSFPVISVANTSGEALIRSVRFHQQIHTTDYPKAAIVPLKCQTGGKCLPVTKEENGYNHEILWGKLRIKGTTGKMSKSFDFLTSNFGGDLPVDHAYPLEYADPIDLCDVTNSSNLNVEVSASLVGDVVIPPVTAYPKVLIAHRGNCRFDVKAMNAQRLGARLLVVIDIDDHPLQRLGGLFPDIGYVGIPSVLVTAEVAQFLESLAFTADSPNTREVVVEFTPKIGSDGFDHWLEISNIEWAEDTTDRLLQLQGFIQKFQQTENHDIVSWLNRRIQEIESTRRLPIETDA